MYQVSWVVLVSSLLKFHHFVSSTLIIKYIAIPDTILYCIKSTCRLAILDCMYGI